MTYTIASGAPERPALRGPRIDIVVPVYNEEVALEDSVRRLHAFLSIELPYAWRIVIADNASTDATLAVARALAVELDHVTVLHLEHKGRGRALRAAWTLSDADVLGYMDVDLSTDLRALLPLVSPLVCGHSEVAIGSRLTAGARVVRGAKREVISRCYNRLLRWALRARFSDAQCGFKAIRADAACRLLPDVQDQGWFFDTELLILAQRRGLRIHEVAVDWIDDPDSRVDIVSTALTDLRGVARLLLHRPVARFLAIGVVSTLAYALLYLAAARAAGRRRRQRAGAGADRGGQHPGQPSLHLPDPGPRRAGTPARRGRGGVPDRTGTDRGRPGRPHPPGPRPLPRARGGGAGGGHDGGDGHALRRPAQLGVRATPAGGRDAARHRPLSIGTNPVRGPDDNARMAESDARFTIPENAAGLVYGTILVATLLSAESAVRETYVKTLVGVDHRPDRPTGSRSPTRDSPAGAWSSRRARRCCCSAVRPCTS